MSDSYKQKVEWWLPGAGESVLNEYRVSIWEDEKVLEVDGGDGCTTL